MGEAVASLRSKDGYSQTISEVQGQIEQCVSRFGGPEAMHALGILPANHRAVAHLQVRYGLLGLSIAMHYPYGQIRIFGLVIHI